MYLPAGRRDPDQPQHAGTKDGDDCRKQRVPPSTHRTCADLISRGQKLQRRHNCQTLHRKPQYCCIRRIQAKEKVPSKHKNHRETATGNHGKQHSCAKNLPASFMLSGSVVLTCEGNRRLGKRIDHSKRKLTEEEEETSRKVIAKELDIDEDLLK